MVRPSTTSPVRPLTIEGGQARQGGVRTCANVADGGADPAAAPAAPTNAALDYG